jgi:small subunit ribosomal protein S19
MPRSVWKGPFVAYSLLKAVQNAIEKNSRKPIRTRARSSTVLPHFVGLVIQVYNGKKYFDVSISEDMVGRKLGEFSPTRTFYGHGADKKAKRG